MLCVICQIRKPRRACPGINNEICTVCCAEGREQTIDCPLTCEYLREGHAHAILQDYDETQIPHQEVQITEEFLEKNDILLAFLAIAVFEGALKEPATTDWDVRGALENLIRKYRSGTGVILVSAAPENQFAAGITGQVTARVTDIRERETLATGGTSLSDEIIVAVLAFLLRLEYQHNNGRKYCRAFLDFLSGFYNPDPAAS